MRIPYPATWAKISRDELDGLFILARSQNLWFFHGGLSGPLWFSPDDLEAEQKNGKFIWGAGNWQLRSPLDQLAQLDTDIRNLHVARDKLARKIDASRR